MEDRRRHERRERARRRHQLNGNAKVETAPWLAELLELGAELWVEGERLRYRAPEGVITPAVRRRLSAEKNTLRGLLGQRRRHAASSFAQRRLWLVEQLATRAALHNLATLLRLDGPLDAAVLAAATDALRARHETLRTTFTAFDGRPFQVIHEPTPRGLPLIDLTRLPSGAREAAARRAMVQEGHRPYDLGRGPLFRAVLVRLARHEHLLLLALHHAVTDGWSNVLLQRELWRHYEDWDHVRGTDPAPLGVQYASFARWQRRRLAAGEMEEHLAYWKVRLAAPLPTLDLPTDRARKEERGSRGAVLRRRLPTSAVEALGALARQHETSPFTVFLAAFAVLLKRWTGQTDLVLGTFSAGRRYAEIEPLIGFFVNTLVLRLGVPGDSTFPCVLAQVRETVLAADEHQDLPFEQLVAELQPERDLSRNPLFQTTFGQVAAPFADNAPAALEVEPVALDALLARFDFDLNCHLMKLRDELHLLVLYDPQLFDATTIERFTGHYLRLLSQIAAEPRSGVDALGILSAAQRQQLLVEWNDWPGTAEGKHGLPALFAAAAERAGMATAVVFEEQELDYRELRRRVLGLASFLRHLGVGPEIFVGVFVERCLDLPVALLAILEAGGAFVPLDPEDPEDRLAFKLADARLATVLVQERLRPRLPATSARLVTIEDALRAPVEEASSKGVAAPPLHPEHPAYMLYTSGSTGRPKGVINTHGAIANQLLFLQRTYGLEAEDRVLQKTPTSFDASIWELLWPLLAGAKMVLARPGGHRDSGYLIDLIQAQGITTAQFVPSLLRVFLEDRRAEPCRSLRRVFAGGEPLAPELAARFAARFPTSELHNLYGPTEAAIQVSVHRCGAPEPGRRMPIGWPVAGTWMRVLDADLGVVPAGVAGELYIGGVQLARGYGARPRWTAERFLPDPYGGAGARLYKSGDRARYRADGRLELLGRTDDQVKVRGRRVELGEIAAVMEEHPGVRAAAVLLHELRPGDMNLVAYVVGPHASEELGPWLRRKLPEAMVPAVFLELESMPLTPGGKLDRAALPRPESPTPGGGSWAETPFVPLRTPDEEVLAGIWGQVLHQDRIGRHDHFFRLGGHSLLATQVASRAEQVFAVDLPVRLIFEKPTLAELAAALAARRRSTAPLPPIVPRGADAERPPLSYAQQRLWFLGQLEPLSAAYNMPTAYLIEGTLDELALTAALRRIVRRHAVLRTRFPSRGGTARQEILEKFELEMPRIDLVALPSAQRLDEARRRLATEAGRPFDLARGPLLRARLLRLDAERHILGLGFSHVVFDGWSEGIFLRELTAFYEHFQAADASDAPTLPPEPRIQYADFAVWQRCYQTREDLNEHLAFWRRGLADAPVLRLPTDRPRPAIQTHRGRLRHLALPSELCAALHRTGLDHSATLYMTSLSAFLVLLGRLSGQNDLVIGSPIANRNREELEDLIGFFVNSLVVRADLTGNPRFCEWLGRVRERTLDVFAHQDLPFEQLVEELRPPRDLSRHPFFGVSFAVQNAPRSEARLSELVLRVLEPDFVATRFDLELYLWEAESPVSPSGDQGGKTLRGAVVYNVDLFDATTIERWTRYFETLLASVTAGGEERLAELAMLSRAEHHQLCYEWQGEQRRVPPEPCLHRLFERRAGRVPEATALVWQIGELTFEELDERANRLSCYLRRHGAGPESVVALFLERSPELVIAVLAVLKAGAAFLPLELSFPRRRLADLLEDAQAVTVLTQEHLAAALPATSAVVLRLDTAAAEVAAERPQLPAGSSDGRHAAYVLYTSGSTGRPKGVVVEHRAAVSYLAWASAAYTEGAPGGAPLHSSLCFDLTLTSLFAPLLAGRSVVLLPAENHLESLDGFLRDARDHAFVKLTPSHLELLRSDPAAGPAVWILGGEALNAESLAPWRRLEGGPRLINEYGPTEAVVGCAVHEVGPADPAAGPLPIGRPIPGARLHLTDSALRPAAPGTAGEILIGGPGLARGYLGQPRQTAVSFVPDPFTVEPGGRLYRSGDLGRQRRDGVLEFLGRADQQLKVRGFRVEPGEIETVLAAHPEVWRAAVLDPEAGRLVAYVVPRARPGARAAWQRQQIEEWRGLYDSVYGDSVYGEGGNNGDGADASSDTTFDTVGWTSSFTDEPLPAAEMREWLDATIERILRLRPRRVLEIGCGTGLVLQRVAPEVESYVGTDFSRSALSRLRAHLAAAPRPITGLRLLEGAAHDFSALESASFDTVVLNSVVQYFPDADYLVDVLRGAVEATAPGGAVFVGDVRHLPLHEAFCASVELSRQAAETTVEALGRSVRSRRGREQELLLAPAFFEGLRRELPRVNQVWVLLKRGRFGNELNLFRYDVILHLDEAPAPPSELLRLDWRQDRLSLTALRRTLATRPPACLELRQLPNRRLRREKRLLELLAGNGHADLPRTVADVRRELERVETTADGIDPDEILELARDAGYNAEASWRGSRADGSYDVILWRGNGRAPALPAAPSPGPLGTHASNPLRRRAAHELLPRWRTFLTERLPDYMVPSAFVVVEELPLTASGKVDRGRLARGSAAPEDASRRSYSPPSTPTEKLLAATWTEVLELKRVDRQDHFFRLGGHSLLATRVVSRLRQALGLELPLRLLFDRPVLAELAASLESELAVKRRAAAPPIEPAPRGQDLPLSFAQQRLWFLAQLEPESSAYHVPAAYRLTGALDVAALKRSLGEIVRRHEVLRTTFPSVRGEPRQKVHPSAGTSLAMVDLRALTDDQRRRLARRLSAGEAQQPFDLERGPLLRTRLLRLDEHDWILLIGMHHIVSDGWSEGIFYRELAALYRAFRARQSSPLAEPAIQYADFAVWQRRWLSGEVLDEQLAYWRRQLAGLPPLVLPTDRPHSAAAGRAARSLPLGFDGGLAPTLRDLGERFDSSLFMTLLAAFLTLLYRYSGQRDLVVGSPIANRNRGETEGLIGFFVNSLVLRGDLAPGTNGREPTFSDVLGRVREMTLAAYAHQDLPFERLVEELSPDRDRARHPLFQVSFAVHNAPRSWIRLPELVLQPEEDFGGGEARFDLELHLWEEEGELHGKQVYLRHLFDDTTAERRGRHLSRLLHAVAAQPEQGVRELPILDHAESHQLLVEWSSSAPRTGVEPESDCLHHVFERRVRQRPKAPALRSPERTLTYRELDEHADRLARRLRGLGVGPESVVGLFLERSPEMVIAVLGVLKAGGAYLPLERSHPRQRLATVMADAGTCVVLTRERLRRDLPAAPATVVCLDSSDFSLQGRDHRSPAAETDPDHLAYVLYTSGSTGRPKGVMVTHRAVVAYLRRATELYGLERGAFLHSSLAFDLTVTSLLGPLFAGGPVEIVPEGRGLEALNAALGARSGPGVLKLTPTHLEVLSPPAEDRPADLAVLILGGEALRHESLRAWRRRFPTGRFFNEYGPTETTVGCTVYDVPSEGSGPVTIGRPLADARIHVLDSSLRPLPAGLPGEFCVAGPGLARGYLNAPRESACSFVPDPFSPAGGQRLYRTGDQARFLPDGGLEFLGRIDQQVKIRGHRVELGEIEAALARLPEVADAVVLARAGQDGSTGLAAFLRAAPDAAPRERERHRQEHLGEWRTLYDGIYSPADDGDDPTFATVGWDSSYTGEPLPPEEMREWLDATVRRIRALGPRRVMEIGCGTGMVLFRVAPTAESYLGTDFSRPVLERLRSRAAALAHPELRLLDRPAHDFSGLAAGRFDTVILNSVIQYFPDVHYLLKVLRGAVEVTAPGGSIFVGDVRSLPLFEAFCASVELARAEASETVGELERRIRRRAAREPELVLDPAFFTALPRALPRVGRVRVEPKLGRADNELNHFRFDVVLELDAAPAAKADETLHLDWPRDAPSLAALRQALEPGPRAARVARVPNHRLVHDLRLLELLSSSSDEGRVKDLRIALRDPAPAEHGATPDDLKTFGRELGYEVELSWARSCSDGSFDVLLQRPGTNGPGFAPLGADARSWESYANRPLQRRSERGLVAACRAALSERLPVYMVPSSFLALDELPVLASGKADRRALARLAAEAGPAAPRSGRAEPRTETERVLAEIWAHLLELEGVGRDDHFFDLGGHSLLATQVASRLRESLGLELALGHLFDHPILADLAASLDQRAHETRSTAPPLAPAPRHEGDPPLSFAQQRLWFLAHLEKDSPAYHMPMAYRLEGPLDQAALDAAWREVLCRHEILRSTYPDVMGEPRQRVGPPAAGPLPLVDLSSLGRRAPAAWRGLAAALARRGFDLAHGPLLRALVARLGPRRHVLTVNLHHIVADGWSQAILLRELTTLYEAARHGQPSPLPELAVQYADFAVWQRRWLRGDVLATQLAYWREQLADLTTLDLPTDRPRPAESGWRGGLSSLRLSRDLTAALKRTSAGHGCSLFMLLLTAFMVFLHRLTGQRDVAVGSPVALRHRRELEDLIGILVNSLVLRGDLSRPASGEPAFQDALARLRETVLGAFAHQDLPFEKLVDELSPRRQLNRHPLFQVSFALQNAPRPPKRLPELTLAPEEDLGFVAVRFDLETYLWEDDGALHGMQLYDPRILDGSTVERWGRHFTVLLASAVAHPELPIGELSLLVPAERHQLLVEWSTPSGVADDECLHHLIARRAERQPDAPAVAERGGAISYRELDERAHSLALHLRSRGAGPEAVVGIFLERSTEMVVAVLAVLKSGAAFLPLEKAWPKARLARLLEESRARLIVTRETLRGELPEGPPILCLDSEAASTLSPRGGETFKAGVARPDPLALAYVLYTSGSTGRPKGVMVPQHAIARYLRWAGTAYGMDRGALLHSSLTFDLTLTSLFGPLVAGGRVEILPQGASLEDLSAALAGPPALIKLTPTHLDALAPFTAADGSGPAVLIVGGEALRYESLAFWRRHAPDCRLVNEYGPTEATVACAAWELPAGALPENGRVAIGRPIAGARLRVLDRGLRPVPPGVAGELCVGGDGLARGYLRQPRETALRFVPDPFPVGGEPGQRLYRTGDLVRYRAGGELEFLGRIDHQVKIRGFRVEPGEIESALRQAAPIEAAVVGVGSRGDLTAHVVAKSGRELPSSVNAWRGLLRPLLPEVMIPKAFVELAALPLTAGGKVDRRALPDPAAPRRDSDQRFTPPRTPIEERLAAIWARVLGLPRIGVDDNFFDLGGDSILTIRIVARAHGEGLHLTTKDLFRHQTVAELARVVRTASPVEAQQGPVTGPVPLTPIQHWFFELESPEPWHYNWAALFKSRRRLDPGLLHRALGELLAHHDALRALFSRCGQGWAQRHTEPSRSVPFAVVDLSRLDGQQRQDADDRAAALQASLDLEKGPLLRLTFLDTGSAASDRLFLVIHHLVIDEISWSVLLEDLAAAYEQLAAGRAVDLGAKTTSFKAWAERLAAHARIEPPPPELDFRPAAGHAGARAIAVDFERGPNVTAAAATVSVHLTEAATRQLLRQVPAAYRTRIDDVLLTALVRAFERRGGTPSLLVDLEGHGREEIFTDVDLSRTVGWFTTIHPVFLELPSSAGDGLALMAVKKKLRRIPRRLGFGLRRYLGPPADADEIRRLPRPEVAFNYLGQRDRTAAPAATAFFEPAGSLGAIVSPRAPRSHLLELNGAVEAGCLRMSFTYSRNHFRRQTIEALAADFLAALEALIAHCLAPEAGGVSPSDFPLAALESPELQALVGRGRGVEDIYPLAPMQEGMLFHALDEPESPSYFGQLAWTSRSLDAHAFHRAWCLLLERHGVLRTSFAWGERPLQIVRRQVEAPWIVLDWRRLSGERRQSLFEELCAADRRRGFDLTKAPLMRLYAVRLAADTYRLLWSQHHLLFDGWSLQILMDDLFHFYECERRGTLSDRPRPRPYREYLAWLADQDPKAADAFWEKNLTGFRTPTPVSFRAPGRDAGREQGRLRPALAAPRTAALEAFARRHQLTLNSVVQGAWALLLASRAGSSDVVFGTTVSGRPPALPGVEAMVGLFINTLPLHLRLSAQEPVQAWLRRVQEEHLEARHYEHHPLAAIQRRSEVPPPARLFDSVLVVENYPVTALPELPLDEFDGFEQTHYPLSLSVIPGTELGFDLGYDAALFDRVDAHRLLRGLEHWLSVLPAASEERLGDLPVLDAATRHQLQVEWNDTGRQSGASTVIDLFAARCREAPTAPAVISATEATVLTYAELDRRADRLARHLCARGIAAEARVGLLLERSADAVVAMLGILKAGGAYVPLDPAYPRQRLELMIDDAGLVLVVTGTAELENAPWLEASGLPTAFVESPGTAADSEAPAPHSAAYILYTSGSTGRPKGVVVEHRSLAWYCRAAIGHYALTARDRVLQMASVSFDISIGEIFPALACGAAVVIAPPGIPAISDLLDICRRHEVTVLFPATALWHELSGSEHDAGPASLRLVSFGGERVLPQRIADWQRTFGSRIRLTNGYGPTEGTVEAALYELPRRGAAWAADDEVPIGRPVAETRCFVIGQDLRATPLGCPGELAIAGPGTARGYLERPALTAERFIPDPFATSPGERLYRTGDRARWRGSGHLELTGRLDHQLKVRGFRVEPQEIEAVLTGHPALREAAVVAGGSAAGGHRRLAAFVVAAETSPPDARELRAFLGERLPEHMVPAVFFFRDALPVNVNGKVDRASLERAAVSSPRSIGSENEGAPRSGVEKTLAEIWAQVLGVERLDPQDNFFELGGDSILTLRIAGQARRAGLRLGPRDIFRHPTVAALARVTERLEEVPAPRPATEASASGPIPLLPIQQRFFNQGHPEPWHHNTAVLLEHHGAEPQFLEQAVAALLRHHEALRLRFKRRGTEWLQSEAAPGGPPPFSYTDLSHLDHGGLQRAVEAAAAALHRSLDLEAGPLLRAAYFATGAERPGLLLLIVHHLVIDEVSWSILLEDLELVYGRLTAGEKAGLPAGTAPFREWARRLADHARTATAGRELAFWNRSGESAQLPVDFDHRARTTPTGDTVELCPLGGIQGGVTLSLKAAKTAALLCQSYPVRSVLLAALARSLERWSGASSFLIDLEGHGREEIFADVDLSRTVGWFMTLYPVLLDLHGSTDSEAALRAVDEQLRAVPRHGIGFGLLRYLGDEAARAALGDLPRAEVKLNYLGQRHSSMVDFQSLGETPLRVATDFSIGPLRSPRARGSHLLEVHAVIERGRLSTSWIFNRGVHRRATIEDLGHVFLAELEALIDRPKP